MPPAVNPADTLISDFQPSELWKNKFEFYATQFVVIC